jgi:hypothetical protein
MKTYLQRIPLALLIAGVLFITSCKDNDADPELPTLALETQSIQGKAGESISVNVNYTTPEGFQELTIEKKLDGESQSSESITQAGSGSYTFEYTLQEDDSEGILTFTFTVFDKAEANASKDLVVEVELTEQQMMTRYDWLLSEEIRENTGENDISEAYTDDVYRFHEDGTYDKSIGEKADDFSDAWFNHCYWNLDDDGVLIMTRTGAFVEDVRDTLYVQSITTEELEAEVIYRGLDVFNTGEEEVPYEPVETYTKVFVSQPKGANFDPYGPGSEDDAGPAGSCIEVTFD